MPRQFCEMIPIFRLCRSCFADSLGSEEECIHARLSAGEELWSLKIVLARTGLSRSTLYVYIAQGLFPKQRYLGPRRVAWLASEILAWMATLPK
jgi:prophage regulatory protein